MQPIAIAGGRSLLLVTLHTGLTHQIRLQASSRNLPLSGDSKYGGAPLAGGYILHAYSLEFPVPPFADLPKTIFAQLPPSAEERLVRIFGEAPLRDLPGLMR
jgi:23S rRNA pseudouridine1911/1915/1917 synthase